MIVWARAAQGNLPWLGLFLAIFLGLFWRVLFQGETFFVRDLGSFSRPLKSIIAPLTVASQGLPLWNPLSASGQPFAGNPQHSLFHPLTTLFFILPFEWAFRLQVLLPLLAAAASMYWFLKTMRRSRPAACVGAMAWAFGGFLLSASNVLPPFQATATLPLTLTFASRLARHARRADAAGLALSFGLQAMVGEPVSLLSLPLLWPITYYASGRQRAKHGITLIGVGGLLGLGLAAVSWLPGWWHSAKTIRAEGLLDDMANEWSMSPARPVELLWSGFFGPIDYAGTGAYWGEFLYPAKGLPYYYSLYPCLLITVLAVWGTRRSRAGSSWSGIALLGYLLALGAWLPLWGLVRKLPLFNMIRFPEKFSVLFVFPLIVAAAQGFDYVVMGPRRARTAPRIVLGVLAMLGFAIYLGFHGGAGTMAYSVSMAGGRGGAVAAIALFALTLAPRLGRHKGAWLIGALVALDLTLAGRTLVPSTAPDRLTRPPAFLRPVLESLHDEVVFHLAEWQGSLSQTGGLANPPIPAQWGLATTMDRDIDFTQLRWSYQAAHLFWKVVETSPRLVEPMLRRRGVTAVVQFHPGTTWSGNRLVTRDGMPPVETLLTKDAQAFAFPVEQVAVFRGEEDWSRAILHAKTAISSTAFIDSQEGIEESPMSPAVVRDIKRTPMQVTFAIHAAGPQESFIAINQTWDPGWHAFLDSAEIRLHRTEVDLSGVLVPPGEHVLRLEYSNPWLYLGLAIALLALVGCLLLVLRRSGMHGAQSPALPRPI